MLAFPKKVWYNSVRGIQLFLECVQMKNSSEFYVVDKRVLPDIFAKVIEAKELLATGEVTSVADAAAKAGISRSAYYKYRDFIFKLEESTRGKTAIIAFSLPDEAGLLSTVLNVMAKSGANILTINQTIPINKIANVTISLSTENLEEGLSSLIEKLEALTGVKQLKIIARE